MEANELEDIFRITNDMLSIVDAKGRFLKLNDSWTRVLGYTLEEIKSKPFHEMVHPEDINITIQAFKSLKEGQVIKSFENRYLAKDGRYVWFNWDSVVLPNGNIFSSARDMTDKMERQQKMQILTKKLEAANRDKDKFISVLAHDLRSPFTTLVGFSEFLQENFETLSKEEILEQIGFINYASNQTLGLLEDILLWSKFKAGKLQIHKERFSLDEICENLIRNVKVVAEGKGINVECIQEVDDRHVVADKNMIKTILRNLFTNAVKFTPQGGIIKIRTGRSDNFLYISVEDTGVGIPDKVLEDIWDPVKSKGLGLTICKELAEQNNSIISVSSQENIGSAFTLFIPSGK
jgi:PAS domain S-box-containing protein